jgi:glycosyltransferase involved in cell wall biosynthesis
MLVSIIVPVYNVEKYLSRCIESILNQTFKDYEVILVDDGSKDNSGKMCDTYSEMYDNFKVIHKENGGLGYARNTGLEYATGKYVMFIDSDDYIKPCMIDNLYNCLFSNHADTCIGGFRRIKENKEEIHVNMFAGQVFNSESIKTELLVRMLGKKPNGQDHLEMSVWKVLFSNDIIRNNNLKFQSERELISEDIVFDLEYYSFAQVVSISDDVGYCYCDNGGSLTTKYRENRFELQKKLYHYLSQRTKELGIYTMCRERIMTTFVSNVRYCVKLEVKFSEENGRETVRNRINSICNDVVTKDVFREYGMSEVPMKSRIVNLLIKYRIYYVLFLVMKIKNRFNI